MKRTVVLPGPKDRNSTSARSLAPRVRVLATVALIVALIGVPQPAAAATGFHAAWVSQDPWPTLVPGTTTTYTIRFRNTGTERWDRGVVGRQVDLGITGDDRTFASLGMAVAWLAADRPATTTEATVGPNEIGTFTFTVRAPSTTGRSVIPVHPVLEGVQHLEDEGAYLVVNSDLGFHSQWVSQSPWPTVQPGQATP